MSLLVVILILILWAICGLKNALTPPTPPIKPDSDYLRAVMQGRTPKERQNIIKNLHKG